LKERELQNKINTQGDIITQLRNQISNDEQTLKFNAAFHALDDKIDAIAAKQPNTVPVAWPNIIAANATPYVGNYYGYGQQTGFFN
jgi:myosin-crossreactive antigen